MTQDHFCTNHSDTSQLCGSQGSPHTISPTSPLAGSMISVQSSQSSTPARAFMRLSRIREYGKQSSQGWCGTERWVVVG